MRPLEENAGALGELESPFVVAEPPSRGYRPPDESNEPEAFVDTEEAQWEEFEVPYEAEDEEAGEYEGFAPPPPELRARIADVARRELAEWGNGHKVETDGALEPRLRAYWAAAGKTPKEIDAAIRTRAPWSAAFVSYVMREAGAGGAFARAPAHRLYVAAAKRARAAGDTTQFQAYRMTEVRPEVGDVLCRDRTRGKKCAETDFDNVDDGTRRAAHGDIVTSVGPGRISTIGGNVGGPNCAPGAGCTVNARQVGLDGRGFVMPKRGACQYFAILKAPTPAVAAAPAAPAPPAAQVGFLKDVSELQTVALTPASPVGIDRKWPPARRAAVQTYNRIGGLVSGLATRLQVEPAAVLAVWRVESGGRTHVPGKAIIRFENHLLFRLWGQKNPAPYDNHFRHGGRGGQPGRTWERHQFRADVASPFVPVHTGQQADEYRALELATTLAGEDVALQCISIGGPQILVLNHRRLGYTTPRQMFDAFQASERWHVIGFFDFCRTTRAPAAGQMIEYLRARIWDRFAYYYNGKGQVAKYSSHLAEAYQAAQAALQAPAREVEWAGEEAGELEAGVESEWENDPLAETWETAPQDEWEWEGVND